MALVALILPDLYLLQYFLSPGWFLSLEGMGYDTNIPSVAEKFIDMHIYSLISFAFVYSLVGLLILILLTTLVRVHSNVQEQNRKQGHFFLTVQNSGFYCWKWVCIKLPEKISKIFYYSTNTWENQPFTLCQCSHTHFLHFCDSITENNP